MDVNGTKYHAVNSASDWAQLVDSVESHDIFWHTDRAELTLLPRLFRFPEQPGAEPLTVYDRYGADADSFGDVFWIDASEKSIKVQFEHGGDVGDYWHIDKLREQCPAQPDSLFQPAAPATPAEATCLRGLAVTEDHYLVVGTLDPAGLLIFDLHAGGPALSWLRWPVEADFNPFDIAQGCGGGVWVLDRYSDVAEGRAPVYWRLDRHFRVVGCVLQNSPADALAPGPFTPESGDHSVCPVDYLPEPFAIDVIAASLPLVTHAVSILALPDDSVLILETDPTSDRSEVHRFVRGFAAGTATLDATIQSDSSDFVRVAGHDFVLRDAKVEPTGEVTASIYVADRHGNQTYVFALRADDTTLAIDLLPVYLPMRRYSGKALILNCNHVHYDIGERWVPLAEKQRPRYERNGTISGLVLDGKQVGCIWHRLFVDACIPPDSAVHVRSRSADEIDALAGEIWFEEPVLYLRAGESELPWYSAYTEHKREGAGTWELLFQNARGRYLELRLELASNGKRSPALRALRVYYPRFSYLRQYLPAVYENDVNSASFVDRFLANTEGLLTELEGHIERTEYLLDVRTAPPEYITWLAGWMGVAFDVDWDDARRRLFLDYAELIYRWRGTVIGLRAAIRIATEPCPDESVFDELIAGVEIPQAAHGVNALRIVESFLTRSVPGVAVGDPTQIVGPRSVDPEAAWDPSLGSEPIQSAFRDYLVSVYRSELAVLDAVEELWMRSRPASLSLVLFQPVVPDNEIEAADWLRFTRNELSFTYADIRIADTQRYQEYLSTKYKGVADLNNAYGRTGIRNYSEFSAITLPGTLPEGGAALFDWIGFVSLTVPIARHAHRFSVLVPTTPEEDLATQTQRVGRIRQVVENEKPANTDFDVKLYWALFRIGAARVGFDTTLGESSRFVAMVLGREYLGQSYIERSHPWNVVDRSVLSRDRLRGF